MTRAKLGGGGGTRKGRVKSGTAEFGRARVWESKGSCKTQETEFILKTQETEFILSEVGSHEAGKQSNDMILFSVCKDPSQCPAFDIVL